MRKNIFVIALSLLVVSFFLPTSAKPQNAQLSNFIFIAEIIAKGQSCGVSTIRIGIDPNGLTVPYSPDPPPNFAVELKIKGDNEDYKIDLRTPGSSQETWKLELTVAGEKSGGCADISLPGFFPQLIWDPNQIGPAKVFDLRLGDPNGPLIMDMRTGSLYQTKLADILNPSVNYIPEEDYALFSYSIVFEPLVTYYRDADNDGHGDPNDFIQAEIQPPGYILNNGDCDDTDPNTYSGASEICDGKDNNCDGTVPPAETTDADGDGFMACRDCDDSNSEMYPGNPEVCDGIDNDCNGIVDDPGILSYEDYYRDADNDGYGDPNNSQNNCSQPAGYVPDASDCNDADSNINPGTAEICDGLDNDCDGTVPADEVDADSDGYLACNE
ncbi:MAG: putative metal-binding motif-containing protein, partial [bacterium]